VDNILERAAATRAPDHILHTLLLAGLLPKYLANDLANIKSKRIKHLAHTHLRGAFAAKVYLRLLAINNLAVMGSGCILFAPLT